MPKEIYYIQGTHCKSCELLIEGKLSQVAGVQKVNCNHQNGLTAVYYGQKKPAAMEIEKAIKEAGYQIGAPKNNSFFSKNAADYFQLIFAGSVLLLVYFLLKIFGILEIGNSFSATPDLLVVGLIGLTAGLSTCMALIGGIVLAISTRHAELHPEASAAQKFRPHLFFNAGRVISYALLGGVIGLIGSSFTFSSPILGTLIFLVGIAMFFLGIKLLEIFPKINTVLTIPKTVGKLLGANKETKEYSHRGAFISGALTFFLPCGFTQAMQLLAISSGSFIKGGLIMSVFALGTLPGLLGIGGLTSIIKGWFRGYFFKFAGLLVIFLGFVNISNGYNLTGLPTIAAFLNNNSDKAAIVLQNNKQVIQMTQSNRGYTPNRLTVKKNIPVLWQINSTDNYNCSSFLVVPALGIQKPLQIGLNTIEFTPTKTGPLKFTCSMGMFSGYLNVIN